MLAVAVLCLLGACEGGWKRRFPSREAQQILDLKCEPAPSRERVLTALKNFAPECTEKSVRGDESCSNQLSVVVQNPDKELLCSDARSLVKRWTTNDESWILWFLKSNWFIVLGVVGFLLRGVVGRDD